MQTKHQLHALGLVALGLVTAGAALPSFAADVAMSATTANKTDKGQTITKLDIAAVKGGTHIVLESAAPFTPSVRALEHPSGAVITVPCVYGAGGIARTAATSRQVGATQVRIDTATESGKTVTRIVADSGAVPSVWSVRSSADRRHWEITLLTPAGSAAAASVASAVGSADTVLADPSDSAPVVRTAAAPSRSLVMPAVYLRRTAAPPIEVAADAVSPLPPLLQRSDLAIPAQTASERRSSGTATRLATPAAATSARPVTAAMAASPLASVPLAHGALSAIEMQVSSVPLAHVPTGAIRMPAPQTPRSGDVATADPAFTESDVEPTARRVSLDFVQADLSEVIKALSVQSGINVVLATNGGTPTGAIQDKITVSLHHVSFAEALDTVVNLSGYRYARIGDTYAVGPADAIATLRRGSSLSDQTTASIPFIFADGATLLQSILSAFPTLRGHVTLVTIGSEGRIGAAVQNTVTDTAQAEQSAASSGGGTSHTDTSLSKVIPKGGVINVAGSEGEIEAVRGLIEATEHALVEAPLAEQEERNRRFSGLTTEVYRVRYASAPDLVEILARLVPTIYITPGPLASFSPNSTGQSVSYTAAPLLQPGQETATGTTGAVPSGGPANTAFTVTQQTTTLLMTGKAEDLARAHEVLDMVDVRVAQVVYEAKVVDINSQDELQLGMTYDVTRPVNIGEDNTEVVQSASGGGGSQTAASVGPTATAAGARTLDFGTILRTPYSITAQLAALANNNRAKVLSNPNLTALDGQQATAFIGDEVKYVINIQQTPQGQDVQTETATVGVTLKLTGHSSPDGTISLYIHPEVSSITSYLNVGNGIQLPQISTKYVDTTVRVKDGETIAIGGLISDTDTKNLQKVPILGDIPFFGELFKYRQNEHDKDEVVVFITTRIVKE